MIVIRMKNKIARRQVVFVHCIELPIELGVVIVIYRGQVSTVISSSARETALKIYGETSNQIVTLYVPSRSCIE